MKRHSVAALLTFFLCITVSVSAETNWRNVSAFKLKWDSRPNVQVILDIPSNWSDPGDFTRIRIRVPGQKEFVLSNKDGWVKYSSEAASILPDLLKRKNLVPSQYVLALNATANGRTLLFLLGYSYASSPGSLDVIELSQAGLPHVILHRKELGLADVRDLDMDGIAEIIAFPCLSQEFGNGLLTYDPINVFKLTTTTDGDAKLSIPLSKRYNIEHYYGWVGTRCSEDFAVVLHPPKGRNPIVLSTKEAKRITQSQ
ncbi:MAG: hypothetical protein WCA21_12380 [Terracidiphilus sp.]